MNIYLLYGDDEALIKKEIDNIIQKNKINRDSVSEYSLIEDSILDIVEDANTIGMFSPKKIIVVNEATAFIAAKDSIENINILLDYLNNYNKDTIMIFNVIASQLDTRKKIVKLIEKNGKIIEFNKKNVTNIYKYVKDYVISKNYKITDNNLDYLIKRLSSNLDLIINELDKIMLYKINDKIINREDIDMLTEKSIEEEIFSLTDAVVKGDIKKSIELYNYFKDNGSESIQIIALLANQFRFLFQVKRLTSKGLTEANIAKELGVHPYRVKLAKETNYYYQEKDYLKYIYKLSIMDEKIKMGEIDKDVPLELFLLKKDI